MQNLRLKTISGLTWTFSQQFSIQIITFIVSVILARILLPEDFGLIAMPTVFLAIGMTLRDSGLSSSLIRTKDATNSDYSTVFYMNLVFSVFVYLILFFCAPLIAKFYNKEILTGLIRVQSLIIIIGAISSIQYTRLTKEMNFKKQMSIQVPSVLISAGFGVCFALLGYGVWSLVFMNLIQYGVAAVHFWLASKWRPGLSFSTEKMKEHFSFGSKLTLSGILHVMYENFYTIIIGKYFGAAILGFYTRAKSTQELPVMNITVALEKVTFSLFSEIQDDDKRLKDVYRKIMQQVIFWIVPTLIIAAIIAEPLFVFVFGEKWLPAVPFFQLLCFVGILSPLNIYNLNILKVKGKSDWYLIAEVVNKSFTIAIAILLIKYGITALLYFQVAATFLSFLLNSFLSGKLINYGPVEQIKNLAPIFFIGLATGLFLMKVSWFWDDYFASNILKVITLSFMGFSLYITCSKIFNISALNEIISIVKNRKLKPAKGL